MTHLRQRDCHSAARYPSSGKVARESHPQNTAIHTHETNSKPQ